MSPFQQWETRGPSSVPFFLFPCSTLFKYVVGSTRAAVGRLFLTPVCTPRGYDVITDTGNLLTALTIAQD
jgi:hypothetical protein